MRHSLLGALLGAGTLGLLTAGSASAGGLERGGYNIDLLFDPSRFAAEATATYVNPQRELDNVVDTSTAPNAAGGGNLNARPNNGIRETEDYWIPRVGLKAGYNGVDCMIDYSQPFGAHINPGLNWAGANSNIETKVNSDNYAGTCSYKFQVGKGELRMIGGAFYQEVDGFKERLVIALPPVVPLTGIGRLDLKTEGWGWRAGVAYEIPEIAFRASLVYNSEVKHDDITGTLDLTQIPGAAIPGLTGRVTDVYGGASLPQSVELKVQSGIAPDWLAFGSVKWVDWSVLQTVSFCPVATSGLGVACTYNSPFRVTSLDLLYQDGWTVSGGIGHKFSDTLSAAASLAWDRGTGTGLSSQSDTWTLSGGGAYTPNQNVEIRLGGAVGILTSGHSGVVVDDIGNRFGTEVSYDFGNDFVGALSGSVKVKF